MPEFLLCFCVKVVVVFQGLFMLLLIKCVRARAHTGGRRRGVVL